jgi:hypothetical protein
MNSIFSEEKASEQNLSPLQIIKILNTLEPDKSKELEKFELNIHNEEWLRSKFQKSNPEELNKLFEFCVKQIEKFPFDKYLMLTNDQIKKLPKKENDKLNMTAFMFEILSKGYFIKNPVVCKFGDSLKEKREKSKTDNQLYIIWIHILKRTKHQRDMYDAEQLLSQSYEDRKNTLLKILSDKTCITEGKYVSFLCGTSNDLKFLNTLKKQNPDDVKKILKMIREQYPTINDRSARQLCVDIYCQLVDIKTAIAWLEEILKSAKNITPFERGDIKHKIKYFKMDLEAQM